MSLAVLLENVMLVALVIGVILSAKYRIDFYRNFFICVLFYAGLTMQYLLKEIGATVYWYASFGLLFLVGMVGIFIIKRNAINKFDVLIIGIFLLGIVRNLVRHLDRYVLHDINLKELYTTSGLVFDSIVVFIIFWPFIKMTIESIVKWSREYGVPLFRRSYSNISNRFNRN